MALTSQLINIMSRIGNYQCLQDTDDDVLSNLFATPVKSFSTRDDQGRSRGISFFKKSTHSIVSRSRIFSLFAQTIRKLESEDVVLCLWLFLQTASEEHRHPQPSNETAPRLHLAATYSEYMGADSMTAAVGFLGRNPCPEFFTMSAILRLDEAKRIPANVRGRYQEVMAAIKGHEDKVKRVEEIKRKKEIEEEIECEEKRKRHKAFRNKWFPMLWRNHRNLRSDSLTTLSSP